MTKFEECATAMMNADWKATGREAPPDSKISNYYAMLRAAIQCLMEPMPSDDAHRATLAAYRASVTKENGGLEIAIFPMYRAMLQAVLDETPKDP